MHKKKLVLLLEKKSYPFHRVCGEYVSNEVEPFLIRHDLFPSELEPSHISKFKLTSTNGNVADLTLDLGGFGVSRYSLDFYLSHLHLSKKESTAPRQLKPKIPT